MFLVVFSGLESAEGRSRASNRLEDGHFFRRLYGDWLVGLRETPSSLALL